MYQINTLDKQYSVKVTDVYITYDIYTHIKRDKIFLKMVVLKNTGLFLVMGQKP